MSATATQPPAAAEETIRTLRIVKELSIAAPVQIVFETTLEQLRQFNASGPGHPMPMKLEAWPGGRWFRDLGNDSGHLWGHVQVIKPPTLLEICGPMFMSFAATSHIQYRLVAEGSATRLKFIHTAIGLMDKEISSGVNEGWEQELKGIRDAAERKAR